jgi:hypothetical protein
MPWKENCVKDEHLLRVAQYRDGRIDRSVRPIGFGGFASLYKVTGNAAQA